MLTLDVIVRTLADTQRAGSLFRALDSIQHQPGMLARPIVVVNGQRFDASVITALRARQGILLHQEAEASMQVARSAGRKLVTAPYFTYLDDDDELIAGALQSPLAWLDQHPLDHAIITNGLFIRSGGRLDPSSHLAMHINDPAMGLLSECWLSPGAFVFRTASISQSVCSADWGQLEWSQLAFELCATRAKIHFMDVATVRYSDTPGSMSKQISHHEANLKLLRSIRSDERLAPQVRSGADRKYLRSLHNMVPLYLASGDRAGAWRCHLGSLRPPYTLKFLLFTRKLLWPRQRHQ